MAELTSRFQNKVCVVTGGGSGIGRATSIRFATEGGMVAILDNNPETSIQTADIITASGGQAIFCNTDVSDSLQVQRSVKEVIDRWSKIDVLVNNAAIMKFKSVVELADDDWDAVINVNLRSVFLLCKYCLPYMKQAAIVNISSVHAHQTEADLSAYAASKGGIEAFTRALSREYDTSCIRVNCVAPGGVNTNLLWSNPKIQAMNPKDVSYAEPESIASVIAFIASADADAVNGSVFVVDNGLLSKL